MLTGHPTPFNSLPRRIKEKLEGPKSGNLYLHHLSHETTEELWHGFAESIETLLSAKKLGVVFFQFPPGSTSARQILSIWFTAKKNSPSTT